jgi:hypothetical protein
VSNGTDMRAQRTIEGIADGEEVRWWYGGVEDGYEVSCKEQHAVVSGEEGRDWAGAWRDFGET